MADIFSKAKRSEIMSKISGKETKPEIKVRKYLFAKGFRYRKNDKKLAGKPDIVLPKYKTVILIHGCFWHSHTDCPKSALPTTNQEFWEKKIQGNVERDKTNQEKLLNFGWNVIVIWQCHIKNQTLFEKTMKKVESKMAGKTS
jgi:DNA mismatch endonuclease (patch repair protein)